jgi:hypothetical protein
MSGDHRIGAGGTWPPDPATADLSDESRFLDFNAAMRVTKHTKRQLQYLVAKHPEISFFGGNKRYFHRVALMTLILS